MQYNDLDHFSVNGLSLSFPNNVFHRHCNSFQRVGRAAAIEKTALGSPAKLPIPYLSVLFAAFDKMRPVPLGWGKHFIR